MEFIAKDNIYPATLQHAFN